MEQPTWLRKRSSAWLRQVCVWTTGVLAWLALIAYGFFLLLQHDTSVSDGEGASNGVQEKIQSVSLKQDPELIPATGKFNLVVAVHPKCPCTRNTLAEIERIQARAFEQCELTFLVSLPGDKSESEIEQWRNSRTVQIARSIPNARILFAGSVERCRRLGLKSSGAVVVLDDQGIVRFSGGVTAGRSCAMENPGALAVDRILQGEHQPLISTPVFGCGLPRNDFSSAVKENPSSAQEAT